MPLFNVRASELLHGVIYPPFIALWNRLRNLTGRQERAQKATDDKAAAGKRQQHKDLWKESHGR